MKLAVIWHSAYKLTYIFVSGEKKAAIIYAKILSAGVQNLVALDLCIRFSTRIIQIYVVTVNESQPLQPLM